MKMKVGKVVHNMAQGCCIPIDSVRSRDNYFNSFHEIEVGTYVVSDKTN